MSQPKSQQQHKEKKNVYGSKSSSNSIMYVAMQLKRPAGTTWGLNLAFFDDRDTDSSNSTSTSMNHQYLMIGDARTDILKRMTSWCHVVKDDDSPRKSNIGAATTTNIDVNRFFNHECYNDASAFISSFQAYWEQLETMTTSSSSCAHAPPKEQKQRRNNNDQQRCLLPGDWILSINGYPPSRFGGTLEHVCQYLRQVNDITIVVARSNIALSNSMQLLSRSHGAVINRNMIAFESAQAAFKSWREEKRNASGNGNSNIEKILRFQTTHPVLPNTPQKQRASPQQHGSSMFTVPPRNDPISRLVTPDHPTVVNHHRQQPQNQALHQRRLLFPSTPIMVASSTNPFHYYHTQKLLQEQLQAREEFELLNHVASANARSLVLSSLVAHQHHDHHQQKQQQEQHRRQLGEHVTSSLPNSKKGTPVRSAANASTIRKLKVTQHETIPKLRRIDEDFQQWLKRRKQEWKEQRRHRQTANDTVSIDVDFHQWLHDRKQQWKKLPRHRYHSEEGENIQSGRSFSLIFNSFTPPASAVGSSHRSSVASSATKTAKFKPPILPADWRNPLFKDSVTGLGLPYCDNWEFTPEEGSRAELFIQPIDDFPQWLKKRKAQWRLRYKVHKIEYGKTGGSGDYDENSLDSVSCDTLVPHDFWRTSQGYTTFDDWLADSVFKWKKSYSWNKQKRKKIQQECEAVVHLPSVISTQTQNEEFHYWLRIRKFQWRIARRKRQRHRLELDEVANQSNEKCAVDTAGAEAILSGGVDSSRPSGIAFNPRGEEIAIDVGARPTKRSKHSLVLSGAVSRDFAAIDDILDHEETQMKEKIERPPLDIELLFDPDNGVPDDVLVQCFAFLNPVEHYKLLFINKASSKSLKERGQQLWRQMCPTNWTLPRRPRKPWHELYFSKLKREALENQKRWDGILLQCAAELDRGDHLNKIEKLVKKGLHVNYCSSVVCERNSLLNLAVINGRKNVVRWLVEEKNADLETFDRGQFTPLMNAAYSGDRYLVRFFMMKGADRTKIGLSHYSKGLAPPQFKGLTAEGWALKQNHDQIACLIRDGL